MYATLHVFLEAEHCLESDLADGKANPQIFTQNASKLRRDAKTICRWQYFNLKKKKKNCYYIGSYTSRDNDLH